ncbi:hypothetical protein Q7P37_003169 [Cladosporium fusiforme]
MSPRTPNDDPLAIPRNNKSVEEILATIPNKPDQIDAICEPRGWWQIDKNNRTILDAYLSGNASIDQTVHRLATSIEESYTSADNGRAFWNAEYTARGARQAFDTAEEAEPFWGLPVQMCEPDPSASDSASTEGQLWRLYFSILHAARKISSPDGGEGQMLRLVQLVQTLKTRPEPAQPAGMTPALRNDWIWSSGGIWSDLLMLGACWAESRDCHPGGLAGHTQPEIHAWENLLAFVSGLKATGTADLRM